MLDSFIIMKRRYKWKYYQTSKVGKGTAISNKEIVILIIFISNRNVSTWKNLFISSFQSMVQIPTWYLLVFYFFSSLKGLVIYS